MADEKRIDTAGMWQEDEGPSWAPVRYTVLEWRWAYALVYPEEAVPRDVSPSREDALP